MIAENSWKRDMSALLPSKTFYGNTNKSHDSEYGGASPQRE